MEQVVLFGLAGLFKAIMDTLTQHYFVSLFGLFKNKKIVWWIYPPLSCENKYRWSGDSKVLRFLFCGILVWVTDLWHFCGMLNIICYASACYIMGCNGHIVAMGILDIPILIGARMSVFSAFYSYLLTKKFWGIK